MSDQPTDPPRPRGRPRRQREPFDPRETWRAREIAIKSLSHALAALTDWPRGGFVGGEGRPDAGLASALLNTATALQQIAIMDRSESALAIATDALREYRETRRAEGEAIDISSPDGGGSGS